ncbi:MAG: ASCH domain-containing protein [Sulfurifustis sp.]
MPSIFRTVDRALLLSVRPKYAEKLLRGEKRVELRRTRPKVSRGDLVLIYESSPTMALVGYGIVNKVMSSASANLLWPRVRNRAGIVRKEFDWYFSGATRVFAIEFSEIKTLREPVWLNKLRRLWNGFHPPQTYRYVSREQMNLVFGT